MCTAAPSWRTCVIARRASRAASYTGMIWLPERENRCLTPARASARARISAPLSATPAHPVFEIDMQGGKRSDRTPGTQCSATDLPSRPSRFLGVFRVFALRTLVEPGHHELPVTQRFRGREPPVARAQHHFDQFVARLVEILLALQQPGTVVVNVLGHGANRARIGAELDHGQDRIADDVSLAGRKGGGAGRRLALVQHAGLLAFLADLLDVAERLLLDGGEPAREIALGRLRVRKVVDL